VGKPTLYVGLHGPLLVPSAAPHEYLGAGIAEYARPFLAWAKDRFDVQVLTDRSPRGVFLLADELGLPQEQVRPRGFDASKTEVMQPGEDFFWVDAELIPSEVTWLAQHGQVHRFLGVDPNVGVTPRHRELLARALRD
jgi:hypothetical protein